MCLAREKCPYSVTGSFPGSSKRHFVANERFRDPGKFLIIKKPDLLNIGNA